MMAPTPPIITATVDPFVFTSLLAQFGPTAQFQLEKDAGYAVLANPCGLYDIIRANSESKMGEPALKRPILTDIHHALQVFQTGAKKTNLQMPKVLTTDIALLLGDYFKGYRFDKSVGGIKVAQNSNMATKRLVTIAEALLETFGDKRESFDAAVMAGIEAHELSVAVYLKIPRNIPRPLRWFANQHPIGFPIAAGLLVGMAYLGGAEIRDLQESSKSPAEKVLKVFAENGVYLMDKKERPIEGLTGRQERTLEYVLSVKLYDPVSGKSILLLQESDFSNDFIEELLGPARDKPIQARIDWLIEKLKSLDADDKEDIKKAEEILGELQKFGARAEGAKETVKKIADDEDVRIDIRREAIRTAFAIDSETDITQWGPIIFSMISFVGDYPSLRDQLLAAFLQKPDITVTQLEKALPTMDAYEINSVDPLLEALGEKAAPLVPILIQKLEDKDASVARLAASILGNMPKVAVISFPALFKALSDPDDDIVVSMIVALSKLGTEAQTAIPKLMEMQKNHPSSDVRQNAEMALTQLREEIK